MTKGFARLAELCKWRATKLLTSLFIHSGAEAVLTPAERCSGTTATPATLLQRAFDLRARRVTPRNPPPCFVSDEPSALPFQIHHRSL